MSFLILIECQSIYYLLLLLNGPQCTTSAAKEKIQLGAGDSPPPLNTICKTFPTGPEGSQSTKFKTKTIDKKGPRQLPAPPAPLLEGSEPAIRKRIGTITLVFVTLLLGRSQGRRSSSSGRRRRKNSEERRASATEEDIKSTGKEILSMCPSSRRCACESPDAKPLWAN